MTINIQLLSDPPRTIAMAEGETMLTGLLQTGLGFPHSCQAGNCGTCKCELVEGDVLELPYSEFALSAEERSRNLILACRTQVWGDCIVRPLSQEEIVLHPSRIMLCAVHDIRSLTHDIRGLDLQIVSGGPFSFSAGQYVNIEFIPGVGRDFSMANHPDASVLQFHVRRVVGGTATEYLFSELKVGHTVKVSGPLGSAYLRENHTGPILAVAGGSGLAPIKSIVESALIANPAREVHLYFGARDERDVYLEDYFLELASRCPNFSVQVVLSEAGAPTVRRRGLVTEAIAEDFPSLDGFKTYIAGPPPMVEAAQRCLVGAGMALRDIHADAFYTQADLVKP